jgi:hypothetical protein
VPVPVPESVVLRWLGHTRHMENAYWR